MVFAAGLLASLALAVTQFRILSKTSYGQKLFLSTSVVGRTNANRGYDDMIGMSGKH